MGVWKRDMSRLLPLAALALAGCQAATTTPAAPLVKSVASTPKASAATPQTEPTALDTFLKRPEPSYKWSDVSPDYAGDGFANLKLTSQTWQGGDWTHRLQVFKPAKLDFPDAAVLNISYGGGSFPESILGQGIADVSGAYAVNVFNVPNQPLYGREEDELVAYSFGKYLETGDASWPILLPMAKSVVKAMDALQAWSLQKNGKRIERFIVTGASKRGWTAYLVAAGDKRVGGAAPVVYDNLNIPAQIRHQHEVWGGTSDLSVAFSNLGLMDEGATGSERGKELLRAVDPYSYLKRLTVPILSINATNDGYWPHDAQTLYRDELGHQTALSTYYAPNSTHFLGAQIVPLAQSAAVWSRLLLGGETVPTISLMHGGDTFTATVSGAPTSVVLWGAKSQSRDFRHAQWRSIPMQHTETGWVLSVPNARLEPFGAVFAQAQWSEKGTPSPLVLASPLWTNGQRVLTARAF